MFDSKEVASEAYEKARAVLHPEGKERDASGDEEIKRNIALARNAAGVGLLARSGKKSGKKSTAPKKQKRPSTKGQCAKEGKKNKMQCTKFTSYDVHQEGKKSKNHSVYNSNDSSADKQLDINAAATLRTLSFSVSSDENDACQEAEDYLFEHIAMKAEEDAEEDAEVLKSRYPYLLQLP